ncbi:MAG: hypothetical protein HRU41_35375 [Saprospiraceae bacterium]|nr:hypothetical protein [Saprospiraceae bacterium]
MSLQKSFCLLVVQLLVWQAHAQFASWHCANLGARVGLDDKLVKGDLKLPSLSLDEFICLGEFYGQRDLKKQEYFLYESTTTPQFQFNGYSICQLEKHQIIFHRIPDLLYEKEEQKKIMAFIKKYNEVVMQHYRKEVPAAEMTSILNPPKVIDPYALKDRLSLLKKKDKMLVTIQDLGAQQVRVKIDLAPLFEDLDLPLQQFNFIVVDEYNNKREELSLQQVREKGFVLQTDQIRLSSSYWYDFMLRVEYSKLAASGKVISCEKTEDYYYHFEHLSVTKDYRLVGHEH